MDARSLQVCGQGGQLRQRFRQQLVEVAGEGFVSDIESPWFASSLRFPRRPPGLLLPASAYDQCLAEELLVFDLLVLVRATRFPRAARFSKFPSGANRPVFVACLWFAE